MENILEIDKGEERSAVDEEKLKEKTRRLSVKEAGIYSVSDGFGFRNVSPYALALGAGNTAIGLLSSLPSLIGNFSQLFTARLMRKYSRKQLMLIIRWEKQEYRIRVSELGVRAFDLKRFLEGKTTLPEYDIQLAGRKMK